MPAQGETLSTTTGTWTQSPTSFAYQWKRNGVAISGATVNFYLIAAADVGSTLTVTVTAGNAAGSVPATSAATGTVTGAAGGGASGFPATVNPLLVPYTLSLAVSETTYPPQFNIGGLDDVLTGDTLWNRRTDDLAGVVGEEFYTHVVTDADLVSAPPRTFTFANPVSPFNALSAIASGSYVYWPYVQRGAARSGAGAAVAHGPSAVAPGITSSASPSGTQFVAGSHALTANQTVTWTITGGADAAMFSIAGSSLNYTGPTTTTAKVVTVLATNAFGNTAPQTITLSVASNTASAFTFTDETAVPQSTVKTSNTITVAGITTGAVPVSITGGTYSKNGGAYTAVAGTAINTDTFAVRQTSSASYVTPTNTVLTIGSTSDTYTVTTLADPAAPAKWVATTGTNKHANITISGANDNIATTTGAGANSHVRADQQPNINAFAFEVTITDIVAAQGSIRVGIDTGVIDYSAAGVDPPASTDTCFFVIRSNLTDDDIHGDAFGIFQTNPANAPATWQDGDIIRVEADKTAGTVKFFFKRGAAAFVQMGTTATLTTMAGWYAVCGGAQAGIMTTNFTGYKV